MREEFDKRAECLWWEFQLWHLERGASLERRNKAKPGTFLSRKKNVRDFEIRFSSRNVERSEIQSAVEIISSKTKQ